MAKGFGKLERDVQRLERTLGTLIAWMAQSANSPIRPDEAQALLRTLRGASAQGPEKE